jgi:PBSX family phage terminase large subunit
LSKREIRYVDYRPFGAAREFFTCKDDEVLMSGPAGTGKSRGLLEKLHTVATRYDGARLLLIRKTRTSLTNTTLITYNQLVLPDGHADVSYQGAKYPNGSVIDFGGMDKASKIMSSEYDIIAVPEATELTENDWESLTTRLRWGRLPYQQIVGDCNPSYPKHFLKQRSNAGRLRMLESRHEDNPTLWNGTDWTEKGRAYIAKLDALTGARYLRLRKGIWAAAEGMVYSDYDAAVHMIDRRELPRTWQRIWSVDFGFTNPFAWQQWARDPDGRLYREKEIYKTQTLVEDHAKEIKKATEGDPRPIAIICDHDAEDRATLERHLGLLTGGAYKAIKRGIQAVQERLRKQRDNKPRIFFMRDSLVETDTNLQDAHLPTCTEEEIESYSWPPNPQSRGGEVPIDRDNHGMDAMRYCVAFVDSLAIEPMREDSTEGFSAPVVISRF